MLELTNKQAPNIISKKPLSNAVIAVHLFRDPKLTHTHKTMVKCKKCITGRKEGDGLQSIRYKLNDLKLKINLIKNNDDLD